MITVARKASLVAWSALLVAAVAVGGCSVVNSPGSGSGGTTGGGASGATGAGGSGATGAGGSGATGAGGSGATGAGGNGATGAGGSGGAEPCTTQEQCAPGYCDSHGVCQPREVLGTDCSQAYECQSGYCVDGVCCSTACGGACARCDDPSALGTCEPQPQGVPGAPSCSPYVCSGALLDCPGSCASTDDCVDGFHCIAPACVACGGGGSQELAPTGAIQSFFVPDCVTTLTIEVYGAQGGTTNGGRGARMRGDFTVTPGEELGVVVGLQGTANACGAAPASGGGGGGSFVWRVSDSAMPLIVAGGGGGGNLNWAGSCAVGLDAVTGTDGTASNGGLAAGGVNGNGGAGNAPSGTGSGGGGWLSNGQDSTYGGGCTGGKAAFSFTGGAGSSSFGPGGDGGFGGGGGAVCGCGGGGGFSGGGGGEGSSCRAGGGGGGSYNVGANPSNSTGVQLGNGRVIFSWS